MVIASKFTVLATKPTIAHINDVWERDIVPTLSTYIKISSCSPGFSEYHRPKQTDKAAKLFADWAEKRSIPGIRVKVMRLRGRSPLIFIEVPGTGPKGTVVLYAHLDKQPPLKGWRKGLGPYRPVRRGRRLYGRAGADDGYGMFAALTAIKALAKQGVSYARCVILIEASEESGSPDLPAYFKALAKQIGKPDLVVCLDSGCGDYKRLCLTTSLRGLVAGNLRVQVLKEAVHSGASGIVPSANRIMRHILGRIENSGTGEILLPGLHARRIPRGHIKQAEMAAAALGDTVYSEYPFARGVQPMDPDPFQCLLNRSWEPYLEQIGQAGLPSLGATSNVMAPFVEYRLSIRVAPPVDVNKANALLKRTFEKSPPYGAIVTYTPDKAAPGFIAPKLAPWLRAAVEASSLAYFGNPVMLWGQGGAIPCMYMLRQAFPEAQFFVVGVLGPHSNAHGPNEFLDLPTARRLTGCVANVIAAHAVR